MKMYLNLRTPDFTDDNVYRAAIARYYLSVACKKPKRRSLAELAARFSYICEAARVVKDLVDDETYKFMIELNNVASFEDAIDELKDAMDYRSPSFIPDFRVLSSAANAFNHYEGTPWVETLQIINRQRQSVGLEVFPL